MWQRQPSNCSSVATEASSSSSEGLLDGTACSTSPREGVSLAEMAENSEVFFDAEDKKVRSESADMSTEAPEGSDQSHSDGCPESRTNAKRSFIETAFVKNVQKSNEAMALQIRALSKEAFGEEEDAVQMKKCEQVAALILDGLVVCYASYIVRRELQSLSICKLAVAPPHRRQGFGRAMLRQLVQGHLHGLERRHGLR